MNSNMRKRIMAILLSGVICVSDFAVPSYASGTTLDSIVESEKDGDKGSASAGIVKEIQGEVKNTDPEQRKENGKDTSETEKSEGKSESEKDVAENTEENTEGTTEDSSAGESEKSTEKSTEESTEDNTEETLKSRAADTGTFSTLSELKDFCESNVITLGTPLEINIANKTIRANANGLILLSCVEQESFEGYTITLNGLSGNGSDLTGRIAGFEQFQFCGLGRNGYPFQGTITVAGETGTSVDLTLGIPLFNDLDVTTAKITDKITCLNIKTAIKSGIALAQTVRGNGDWSSVEVNIEAYDRYNGETRIYTQPGSCIGVIEKNTDFTLGKVNYKSDAEVNTTSGNAGLLCNTIKEGGRFEVKNVQAENPVKVTSENGAAGGLTGYMEKNASFSLGNASNLTIGENWTVTGKNAGALIGEATNAVLNLNVTVNGAKVISNASAGSAGGLIGTYHLTSEASELEFQAYGGTSETIQIQNVVLDATGSNSYIGALFGVLELSKDFSIHGAAGNAAITSTAGFTKNGGNFALNGSTAYGGLAGRVYGTDSNEKLPALILDGNIASESTTNSDITYYGGLIGVIGTPGIDNANTNGAYVVTNGQTSTTCNNSQIVIAKNHYFGGAVGGIFYHSVFEIAENSTFLPTASGIKYGGGIVGVAGRGSTLRLAGTTDLSNVTFTVHDSGQNPGSDKNNRFANGQIAGIQNAAVIYAAKSWVFTRPGNPGEIDDIGNYGSVIRLGRNIGRGSSVVGSEGGLSESLIQQEATTHKTVFGDAAPLNKGEISISSADQFALLSIAEQTYGDFGIYPAVTGGHIISGNKVAKITLEADIDLSNTGISGLQRDFYYANNVYTGELDGKNHKLTLDIGQIYANQGDGAGNGQIHGHSQVGLFSQANATIKNLTINGNIKIRERKLSDAKQKSTMAVGGCIALSTGGASTFENVTTNVTIQCSADGTESFLGALIGLKNGTDSSVSIIKCTGNAAITDETSTGVHTIGGLIGVYTGGGTITVSDTKLTGQITGGSIPDAKYGGLISVMKDKSFTMNLDNLTVNGQKIENSATATSGGLLGYEWNDSKVYFGDGTSSAVTVQGDSAVTVTGNASVGALVYRATGYWQVNHISFTRADIQNKAGDLGLLICHGRKSYIPDVSPGQGAQLLYLEETKFDAYHIEKGNVTVSSTGGYYDEWVVYTAESAETITDNGNSVISIATEEEGGKRKGFDPAKATSTGYQNRTTNNGTDWSAANPNARYYYDLDEIRGNAATTVNKYVDTPGELVLWSVWRYCEKIPNAAGTLENSNIQQYFATDDIKSATIDGNNKSIDLTGYSYYPVNVDAADAEIQNCTVVFANQVIEDAESLTGNGLDTLNRKTSGTEQDHTQHYLMHSGLILDYWNTSTTTVSVTLSVNQVTLQGTVGKGPDGNGSGAVICGTVAGSGVGGSHFANMKLNGVVLDGLTVNSDTTTDGYAPLLINTAGSYVGIDAQKISTTTGYDLSKKAATSLIGHVGSENATNISLAFSNGIALNGRTAESIFSHATLLESFQFSGASSSGYYHFNENEKYTYGREINGTVENIDEQLYYFDTRNPIKDGENTDFNTAAYLPYVCQTKVTDENRADTFHELEINIVKPDLDQGCGTYDDPYIIDQPAQLQLVAQYIARDAATAGWKINMVTGKEKIKSESDENHKTYTYGDGSWTSGSATCEQIDMRNYLRNAYYKIDSDLQLSKFEGLGTTTYPFRGVVEGSSCTITIDASNITSGFVNVSYGSVIQNLSIIYTGTKELQNVQAALNSNTVADQSYFGGIIGDVKGGDNLIRNVSVVYRDGTDNFSIKIQNHLQCVGGFLGIVEGGGVVFSGMSKPDGLKTSQIDTALDEKNPAYVSPLVGRVLDGFVMNEVAASETEDVFESKAGSDKNYSIGNIPDGSSLSVTVQTDGIVKVEVDKEEELLLLSAIINSGACSAGYSLSYKNVGDTNAFKADSGKVRNADYSKIGNPGNLDGDTFKTQYFDLARKDDAKSPASSNLSYLITRYAGKESGFWDLCSATSGVIPTKYLNLSILADLDLSGYKNGYRGIGGRYNCTASCDVVKTNTEEPNQTKTGQFQRNTPVFTAIDGNNCVLNVDNRINGYSDDNYVANAAGGLVNVLRRKKDTSVTIQNLTVKGYVELHDFSDQPDSTSDTNASGRGYAASVGGVIGRYFTEETGNGDGDGTYLQLSNLIADNLTLYSDGATGGIVGQTGVKTFFIFGSAGNQYTSGVTYTDCRYSNLTATSCQSTGGIVGAACDNAVNYNYGNGNSNNITNNIISDKKNVKTGDSSTLRVYANKVTANGLGGLIGNVGSNVEINKEGTQPLILDSITLQDSQATGVSRTGGAIGFLHHGTTTAYKITISNSTLGNGKEDNLGGIVGCWYSSESGGVMEDIVIDHCALDADLSVGGVVGYIANGAKIIRNITVKDTTIKQRNSSTSRGVALVVGQIAGGGIYGQNILLKDSSIDGKTGNNGRIVGYVDGKKDLPIQLLGVSVQYGTIDVSKRSKSDIGNIPYDEYLNRTNKIMISYDAFLTDQDLGSDLDKWPAVTIRGIGTEDQITGDTALPYTITGSNDVTGIVKKEGTEFTYIGANKNYQNVDPANVDKLVPGIVSTYNANQDTKINTDFHVVQIDGSAACLKQYLNAATNGAFGTGVAINSETYMKVDIRRYKWNSTVGKFEDVTNKNKTKPTLTYDPTDGNFYATAEYDNQNDMFTLVSVTFKTKSNDFSRTYDIPVVVRRMLQVDFMATMVSGTVFHAAEMEKYNTHALASVGEEITGYLTFTYNSNRSGQAATYDWQSYMEAGANLLGYYQKTMDTGLTELPAGTQITLIDCQQSERRYHAVVPDGMTSSLELFNGGRLTFQHSGGDLYQPVSLAELLQITAEPITDADTSGVKKWVHLDKDKKGEATVVDQKGEYYRLYDSNKDDENTACFELNITNHTPEENYFVVISIPKAENHMLTLIKSGGVTKGSMTWSDSAASAPPTEVHQLHRYTDESGGYTEVSTNVSSEISFNFLDNYRQTLKDTLLPVESIPIISVDTFVKMNFELQNEITFEPANYEQTDPLYQELRVSLQKTVDDTASDVYFPSDAKATVDLYAYYMEGESKIYFKLDSAGRLIRGSIDEQPVVSYEWIAGNDGNMILPFAVLKDGSYQYIDLSPLRIAAESQKTFYLEAKLRAPVSIGISSVINNDLLPVREVPESQNQTKMQFTSVLSFKESGLSYSTLRGSTGGNKGYYLNEKREAVLKLDYLNVDQLGINLRDEYSGEINTVLTLDFSGAEGFHSNLSKFEMLNNADAIVFEFSLKQKGQSGLSSVDYGEVSIGDYLTGASITGGNRINSFRMELRKENGSYPYYNEAAGVFSIPVTFKVGTENVAMYSNYRIYASAVLQKEGKSQNMAVNAEKAFITYTVAKININGIWETSTGN